MASTSTLASTTSEAKAVSQDNYGTLTYPIQGIQIDPVRLRADLENVLENETFWKRQNKYKNVGWKGVALYSRTGKPDDLMETLSLPVQKTKVGDLCRTSATKSCRSSEHHGFASPSTSWRPEPRSASIGTSYKTKADVGWRVSTCRS